MATLTIPCAPCFQDYISCGNTELFITAALEPDIHVPQAFTPNNDGHNDKLFVYTVNIKELKYFKVFNRWGQLVFQTNSTTVGWDGMFNGKPAVTTNNITPVFRMKA